MSTLLLRLAGAMQSWGIDSRFDIRFSAREPSKSGVIGLLCAALGKPREEQPGDGAPPLTDLARLYMGVRVDRPGTPQVDYQTAGGTHRQGDRYGVVNAMGRGLSTVQSRRYYLADADFLVGLAGEDEQLLRRLDAALQAPVWQLCLGRKAYAPSAPIRLPDGGPDSRWWQGSLDASLRSYPWRPRWQGEASEEVLRLVIEAEPADAGVDLLRDVPVDFASRRFAYRWVRNELVPPPQEGIDVSVAP